MKKSIILSIVLVALTLTAYSFIKWNATINQFDTSSTGIFIPNEQMIKQINENINPNFFYDLGTRFNSIKKEELMNATSFSNFIAKEHSDRIVSYQKLSVILLDDSDLTEAKITNINSGDFTPDQMAFLSSLEYSTNVLIWADYTEVDFYTDQLTESTWTPYLTVVPEKQAVNEHGNEALLNYLKYHSKGKMATVQEDKLKQGQLYFTITKDGTVSNVKIVRTSGYPAIDKMMIDLINKMPGKWQAAENSKGDKVNQDLVFSFGRGGC